LHGEAWPFRAPCRIYICYIGSHGQGTHARGYEEDFILVREPSISRGE